MRSVTLSVPPPTRPASASSKHRATGRRTPPGRRHLQRQQLGALRKAIRGGEKPAALGGDNRSSNKSGWSRAARHQRAGEGRPLLFRRGRRGKESVRRCSEGPELHEHGRHSPLPRNSVLQRPPIPPPPRVRPMPLLPGSARDVRGEVSEEVSAFFPGATTPPPWPKWNRAAAPKRSESRSCRLRAAYIDNKQRERPK
ncbi:hypothetical protein HPB47_006753, partial [Ixodes persulcatus]